jgi:hypothetical protein
VVADRRRVVERLASFVGSGKQTNSGQQKVLKLWEFSQAEDGFKMQFLEVQYHNLSITA